MAVVRLVALDLKHDPDKGFPVTPDDAPDLSDQKVWAVWEQVPDDTEDGFHWKVEGFGMTADEAEERA